VGHKASGNNFVENPTGKAQMLAIFAPFKKRLKKTFLTGPAFHDRSGTVPICPPPFIFSLCVLLQRAQQIF
jgi:hypothetical protein